MRYTISPESNGRLHDSAVAGSGLHLHTFDTQYYETPMPSTVVTWVADKVV